MQTEAVKKLVSIPADQVTLEGLLELPENAAGIVLFAHGSGSSRHSPRNNFVAQILRRTGTGTLLFDLLTSEEDIDYETRFNIPLLTGRLLAATSWTRQYAPTRDLALGYFGASTGAAAALQAAAKLAGNLAAVVSRGGRPDLAGKEALGRVQAPTLLLVGGQDEVVIGLNQRAHTLLSCKKKLSIIPDATHLFEEPGTLEQVAEQAADWFKMHLGSNPGE
jgi:pimeloyl-ACP methyl ester carboxylesterase